jgi:hypothetical protein
VWKPRRVLAAICNSALLLLDGSLSVPWVRCLFVSPSVMVLSFGDVNGTARNANG